jgi:acetyltransferase-like isoleucine patch superfamily enzyme
VQRSEACPDRRQRPRSSKEFRLSKVRRRPKGGLIHEKALVESDQVGCGTRVWAFAHIMKGAVIGENCNICEHCFIEAGARLGDNVTVKNGVSVWDKVTVEDNVFLGPSVVLTNDLNPRAAVQKPSSELVATLIRQGATLGANATILCGNTIGRHAFIGAGAVITHAVNDYEIWTGNPARRTGWMCACGTRIPFWGSAEEEESATCPDCQARYTRRDGLVEEAKGSGV